MNDVCAYVLALPYACFRSTVAYVNFGSLILGEMHLYVIAYFQFSRNSRKTAVSQHFE